MSRTLKVCPTQGCVELIPRNERLCSDCEKKRQKKYNSKRPSSSAQGYDYKWRKIRDAFLKANPFCFICGNLASQVDHIIPLSRGGTNHLDNLQSLCVSCHSKKTVKFDGGFGRDKVENL